MVKDKSAELVNDESMYNYNNNLVNGDKCHRDAPYNNVIHTQKCEPMSAYFGQTNHTLSCRGLST